MMVYSFLSSCNADSTLPVEMGSRARSGLIEQNNFGLKRQHTRQAETLLLSAREGDGGIIQAVFDLLP